MSNGLFDGSNNGLFNGLTNGLFDGEKKLTVLINEPFNGVSSNYTTVNNSTGGITANAAWTLRANGYVYSGSTPYTLKTLNGEGAIITNSDAQGGPVSNVTETILTFKKLDCTNNKGIFISFDGYHRISGGNILAIEVSYDKGITWSRIVRYVNSVTSLTAGLFTRYRTQYIPACGGKQDVRIRLYYRAQWGFYWMVNNFKIIAIN